MKNEFTPNNLRKLWFKITNKKEYRRYKRAYSHFKITSKLQLLVDAKRDTTIDEILFESSTDKEINVFHSGNAGDIIYALPVMKKLREISGKQINLLLKIGEPLTIGDGYEHPLGAVMLDENMVRNLLPLIVEQEYIHDLKVFDGEKIHLDLTLFRNAGFILDKGEIGRWNFFTSGVTPDLYEPWLKVAPNDAYAEHIVLARSSRYNNAMVDHSFLASYDKLIFLGVESEYMEMKKSIPNLKWAEVGDFLELARIIAGSKLFIGNQSFPYSVAEGLKVNRLLEVFYQAPNVIPAGKGGYDFCFQKHFEWLVKQFAG